MAAKPLKHLPGSGGTVIVDAVHVRVRGWKGKRSVATYDDSGTEGSGWTSSAPGLKSFKPTFTMDVPTAGLPTFDIGNVYACSFTLNGVIAWSGDMLITDMDPAADLKGGCTLDVSAENVDEVTTSP